MKEPKETKRPPSHIKCRSSIHQNSPSPAPEEAKTNEDYSDLEESKEDNFEETSSEEVGNEKVTSDAVEADKVSQKDNFRVSGRASPIFNIIKDGSVFSKTADSLVNIAKLTQNRNFLLALIIIAAVMLFKVVPFNSNTLSTSAVINCSFDELQRKYPQQQAIVWRSLSVGIENILNKRTETSGVYLFVHQGGNEVHQLVHEIAAESSRCFGHKMKPVEIKSEDLISEHAIKDYGNVIEKFRRKIKDGNVIIIANLNEIPAEAARAFHTICDTHNPIAKDVIIFLTLVVPDIKNSDLASVQDTLFSLWGPKLVENELDPLITRVTDQVIQLQA